MNKLSTALFASILVVGMGCSKSPLTDEQKARVETVTGSISDVKSAGQKRAQRGQAAGVMGEGEELPETGDILSKLDNCQPTFNQNSSQMASPEEFMSEGFKFALKLEGEQCPLKMEFSMNMQTESQTKAVIDMVMLLEITDEELAKLSDVTFMDVRGKATVQASGDSASMKGDMNGKIVSKSEGEVKYRWEMSGNDDSAEMKITMDFKDFSTEFVQTTSNSDSGKTTYLVNGSEVDEEEFTKLIGGALGVQ